MPPWTSNGSLSYSAYGTATYVSPAPPEHPDRQIIRAPMISGMLGDYHECLDIYRWMERYTYDGLPNCLSGFAEFGEPRAMVDKKRELTRQLHTQYHINQYGNGGTTTVSGSMGINSQSKAFKRMQELAEKEARRLIKIGRP